MKFAKVRNVKSPERGTGVAAGIDFFIPEDFGEQVLPSGHDMLIPSGIKMEIPHGYMLIGADKSGIATSAQACIVAGRKPKDDAFNTSLIIGAKVIDEDYEGEIHIHVINVGLGRVHLRAGMKIAQFILVPVSYEGLEEVKEMSLFHKRPKSMRGDKGFGLGTGN